MRNTIKLPLGERRVSSDIIVKLMLIGALRAGEYGLSTGDPGLYPKKKAENGILRMQ